MTLVIEGASCKLLHELCEIEKQCFREEAFSKHHLSRFLNDYNSITLVAKKGPAVVGFVIGSMYPEREGSGGHIVSIDVLPKYRRQEIGTKLMTEIERLFFSKGAKNSTLEVREANIAAIHLYERMGYERVGVIKDYYPNGNAVFYTKSLEIKKA